MIRRSPWLLVVLAFLAGAGTACAHPHVFVRTKTALVFGRKGTIIAVRHSWTFDDMYSAFVTGGLTDGDKLATREQLAPLAKTNVEQLAEYNWFTFGKAAGSKVTFEPATDYWLEEGPDKLVTLNFTLPLTRPASTRTAFSLQIYDPTYFIDFEPSEKSPLTFVAAPEGCSVNVFKPEPLAADDKAKLTESFFTNLSPGTDFGMKMASRAIVACP